MPPTTSLPQASPNAGPLQDLLTQWEARSRGALPTDAMLINRHVRELRQVLAALGQIDACGSVASDNLWQQAMASLWIDATHQVPTEADGEVFVRFTDGSLGTAWATYWHGTHTEFARWSTPDPDDERAIAHWMKAPSAPALEPQP